MSELKPGMIAHLRTTGEPVFILSIRPTEGFHVLSGVLSGVIAKVRRPTFGDHNQVVHHTEDFLIDELETKEESALRQVREMEGLKASFEAERAAKTPGILGSSN